MPRLAPDGVRCKETRITTGTAERKMMALMIKENQKDRRQKYLSSFALPVSVIGLGLGVGVAGYFMAPSILQDAKDKVQDLVNGISNTVKTSEGINSDGSYVTILCVGYADKRQFDGSAQSPNEGRVIVNVGSGIPVVGGLSSAFLYAVSYTSSEEWVGVWGNRNKDAKRIEDLSEGWLYLDPSTNGPMM